jgi:hypothetical protein
MLHYHRAVARTSRLDGVIFDGDISFTTLPLNDEQPHTSWNVPFYRVEAEAMQADVMIEVTLKMNDIRDQQTWQWDYRGSFVPTTISPDDHIVERAHT